MGTKTDLVCPISVRPLQDPWDNCADPDGTRTDPKWPIRVLTCARSSHNVPTLVEPSRYKKFEKLLKVRTRLDSFLADFCSIVLLQGPGLFCMF